MDPVAEENPKVVEDLVPKLLFLAVVQKIIQNLLRERVSIREADYEEHRTPHGVRAALRAGDHG